MNALLLTAPVLSLALLAAHFHRAGQWPLEAACVALAGALALPRAWVARLVQASLVLGALEWSWTLFVLVQQRLALGQPWLRLAIILGTVALLTLAAATVFRSRRLRRRYRLG